MISTPPLSHSHLLPPRQLEGEPPPEAVWLREGIPLPPGLRRLQSSQLGDRCQLVVSGVRPSDQGTYTCHAINTAGECSTFTRITVVERELLLEADRAITRSVETESGDGGNMKDVRNPGSLVGDGL